MIELRDSGIHVAQYLTNMLPKELLERKFIDSIEKAKMQLNNANELKNNK